MTETVIQSDTFEQSLTILALPLLLSAFPTCISVAVNTAHSCMIVLTFNFSLALGSFS